MSNYSSPASPVRREIVHIVNYSLSVEVITSLYSPPEPIEPLNRNLRGRPVPLSAWISRIGQSQRFDEYPVVWLTTAHLRRRETGMTEYQKSFHAHYLPRTLRLVKELYLRSANQVAVMRALTTVHPAPMLRRLELDVPEMSEAMVQYISQWEAEGQLDYLAIRLHRTTPTLKIMCSLLSLKKLNMSETCITDKDMDQLSTCRTLAEIDLSSCRVLTNINPLSSIATLEVINLSDCTSLTHVADLGKLPKLSWLSLNRTPVMDEEVDSLNFLHEQLGLPFIEIEFERTDDDD